MTTFKISHRNSKPYLYAFCGCGEICKVPAAIVEQYMAVAYRNQLSINVRRGMEAARMRGVQLGRPARRNNGDYSHKSN